MSKHEGLLMQRRGNSANIAYYDSATRTFAAWRSLGFDTNGMSADPLFTAPGSDDFTLQPGSPARDAGTYPADTVDYAGNSVPQGSGPDIGALEH